MANQTAEKLEACAAALRRHHFEAEVVKDTETAFGVMKAVVEAERPQLVSFGDSTTMRATGIIEWMQGDGRLKVLDGFDASMPYDERLEIRRQALLSDLFITGVNAITEQGTLHWLDKVGNRIAPVAFGPRKVIIVAGRNKITADREKAEERIRRIAAPQNVARHPGFRTPCAKTGVCMDCNSQDRICNTRMEMLRCWPDKRVLVVLIDQDLGL
ncbi:lactate utilization protein [Alistipes sp. kh20]|uniref:lactate utilization protein n=1 Tax=Alistipes montrealensis TaxID=2834113 RepID=UPI001BCEE01E|nr:lactate utilization protein [Alistipes montrealensis]MBS4766188.1 lactate utilization protein [Alistipes montrealensis]